MRQPALANAIKNDEWIDAVEGEPKDITLPHIPGYHLLIRPMTVKAKTKSGIFIPDSLQDDIAYLTTVGKVEVVGDLAYEDKNKFPKGPWCTVGDHVCYGKLWYVRLFWRVDIQDRVACKERSWRRDNSGTSLSVRPWRIFATS